MKKIYFYLASGEYIVRMDGDDISAPDRIEKLIIFLKMNTEYELVGSSLTAIDINYNEIGKSQRFSDYDLMVKLIKYDSPVSHIWAARKSLYDTLNGYRELSGVEDYYGYFVRLGRGGNTISLMGVKQKKLHQYAYKLYLERLNRGTDSFSMDNLNSILETNKFLEKLYAFSSRYLYKVIESKGNKKYFKMLTYLIPALLSPHIAIHLYNRFKVKSMINNFKSLIIISKDRMKKSFFVYILMFFIVGLFADKFFEIINSNSSFVDIDLWILIGLAFLLERYGAMYLTTIYFNKSYHMAYC